jgi:ubiquinone/menaquinone biosynthesis C-methylase UbiE
MYDFYSFNFIPVWGQLIANDYNSYQYLVESIRKFPNQEAFAEMISQAGFSMVNVTNLTFGVSAIHSGWKL